MGGERPRERFVVGAHRQGTVGSRGPDAHGPRVETRAGCDLAIDGTGRHQELAEAEISEEGHRRLVEPVEGRPDRALGRAGPELLGDDVLASAELGGQFVAEPGGDGGRRIHGHVGRRQRLAVGQQGGQTGAQLHVGGQPGATECLEQLGLQHHRDRHARSGLQGVGEQLDACTEGGVEQHRAVGLEGGRAGQGEDERDTKGLGDGGRREAHEEGDDARQVLVAIGRADDDLDRVHAGGPERDLGAVGRAGARGGDLHREPP